MGFGFWRDPGCDRLNQNAGTDSRSQREGEKLHAAMGIHRQSHSEQILLK